MLRKTLQMLLLCGIYIAAWQVVTHLWPLLREWKVIQEMNPDIPRKIATTSAFGLFVVLGMVQRGMLNPESRPFQLFYGGLCAAFALSTLHPSQYNEGSAALQVAFVTVAAWTFCYPKKQASV